MLGRYYNAKNVTVDGGDYWLAYIVDASGKFSCKVSDISYPLATEAEAAAWLKRQAHMRGEKLKILKSGLVEERE